VQEYTCKNIELQRVAIQMCNCDARAKMCTEWLCQENYFSLT